MNAAVLVWFVFNVHTGQPAFRDAFPTQAVCLRGVSALHQVQRRDTAYICEPMTVASPWGSTPLSGTPATNARAQRNYQSEQAHIAAILSHSTHPIP